MKNPPPPPPTLSPLVLDLHNGKYHKEGLHPEVDRPAVEYSTDVHRLVNALRQFGFEASIDKNMLVSLDNSHCDQLASRYDELIWKLTQAFYDLY